MSEEKKKLVIYVKPNKVEVAVNPENLEAIKYIESLGWKKKG